MRLIVSLATLLNLLLGSCNAFQTISPFLTTRRSRSLHPTFLAAQPFDSVLNSIKLALDQTTPEGTTLTEKAPLLKDYLLQLLEDVKEKEIKLPAEISELSTKISELSTKIQEILSAQDPSLANVQKELEIMIENLSQTYDSYLEQIKSNQAGLVLTQIVDVLHIKEYGAWYIAAVTLILATVQRNAAKKEAMKEFETELKEAQERADEAVKAALEAAEGANRAKELAKKIPVSMGGDGVETVLDESQIRLLEAEKQKLKEELEGLNTEITRLQTQLENLLSSQPDFKPVDEVYFDEESSTKTDDKMVVPMTSPEDDLRILEVLKEMEEENRMASSKGIMELEAEAKAKAMAERKKTLMTTEDKEKVNEEKMNEEKVNEEKVNEEKMNEEKVNEEKVNEKKVNEKKVKKKKVKAAEKEHPWAKLTKSKLERKTVPELSDFLTEKGISVKDESGKKLPKKELLSAVRECLNKVET